MHYLSCPGTMPQSFRFCDVQPADNEVILLQLSLLIRLGIVNSRLERDLVFRAKRVGRWVLCCSTSADLGTQ